MNGAVLVAIVLTVGATFKAAAVPFHFWTPDAYQGHPPRSPDSSRSVPSSVPSPSPSACSARRWARSARTGSTSSSCWPW